MVSLDRSSLTEVISQCVNIPLSDFVHIIILALFAISDFVNLAKRICVIRVCCCL